MTSSPSRTSSPIREEQESFEVMSPGKTRRPKAEPLWKTNAEKTLKNGQRGTIYWVGLSIIGEDGLKTDMRAKGTSYHGEWTQDQKTGYGVQFFPNGEKYDGQWARGMRNGEGTLWVPSEKANKLRKLYVGSWKDDRRHGRGTCYFKSGEYYQGSWDNGKMHGQGTLRYSNGDLYIGEWFDGQRCGRGILNKANGDCYEGQWLNDKREGSGSFFYAATGKVFVGEWADDMRKAGVYTQAHPNPEQDTVVPTTSVLPPVRLAQPAEVLEEAISVVQASRREVRGAEVREEELFEPEFY